MKIKTKPTSDLDIVTHRKNLISLNYTENPVDIWTFLSHSDYLGNITDGGRDIYPIWKEALIKIFSDNTKTTIVLTGGTGTGKTTIAIYALLYIQYKLMILRDPWKFFDIGYSGKLSISFFNLNKTLSESRGYAKMQAFMSKSPWFRKHAFYIYKLKDGGEELEFERIKYLLSSPYTRGGGIIGEDIVSGVLDEVDAPNASKSSKERIIEIYEATSVRFKNRFAITGYSLGKLFIVSSKQEELSFIDTFIAERKNLPEVLIFDINVWEAKPKHIFCGTKFPVAVGDVYNPSKMVYIDENIPIEQQLPEFQKFREEYLKKGYKIIDVPIEFKNEFRLDLLRSLKDLAGITVTGLHKYKLFGSEQFIINCFDPTKLDPVKVSTINIGLEDQEELIWFLDLNKIRVPKTVPRCIHLDISFSQDASGLAMSSIKDWKEISIQNPDGTYRKEMVPIVETDFVMRIKAKEGNRIPIRKIRKFVLDLKAVEFNIFKFTADLRLASEDTLQLLRSAGINAGYFSVSTSNQPYFDFRNLVFEKRWICHKHQYLFFELKNLEEIEGKIDHPKKITEVEYLITGETKEIVLEGSKDLSDAVVGSVIGCLQVKKSPMNLKAMSEILKGITPEIRIKTTEDFSKLIGPSSNGKKIIAEKTEEGITKFSKMLKGFTQPEISLTPKTSSIKNYQRKCSICNYVILRWSYDSFTGIRSLIDKSTYLSIKTEQQKNCNHRFIEEEIKI